MGMIGLDREELARKLEEDRAAWVALKAKLTAEDHVEDGYPTEAALELVRKWHWTDLHELFDFVKSIWHLASWGWRDCDAASLAEDNPDYDKDGGDLLFISTGGWSGNESIISALQDNWMAWSLCWVQSRRGGHYIFKPREIKDEA